MFHPRFKGAHYDIGLNLCKTLKRIGLLLEFFQLVFQLFYPFFERFVFFL